jgi:F-type H+-transporting ATPase subunit gamma
MEQLVPLPAEDERRPAPLGLHLRARGPGPARQLLTRYIESQVYQAVVENAACEQAARMLAMKNATDNAGELIDELQLVYNKARQAAITQELSEIVSGAAVVSMAPALRVTRRNTRNETRVSRPATPKIPAPTE